MMYLEEWKCGKKKKLNQMCIICNLQLDFKFG